MKRLIEKQNNDSLFILEGILGALVLNLINPFLSMFATRLGANDFHIGLVSSMPALAGILALIPGALLVDKQLDKKRIISLMILLSGIIYPLAIFTPYLGKAGVLVFIIIISVVNWPVSVYGISWQAFFSDIYSDGSAKRNLIYTKRSVMATIFGTLTLFCAGLVLTYLPSDDSQRIFIYQIFFAAALLLSLLQSYFLMKVKGYKIPLRESMASAIDTLTDSLKKLRYNRKFCIFMLIVFYFYITWQMAWPLFFIYQVSYLHANEIWLSYFTIAANIATAATFPFWRRVIEIKGAQWAAIIITACQALNPLLTVISPTLFLLVLVNIFNGLTNSGFQLVLFDNILEVIPRENKTLNIAIYTTLLNISGLMAPVLGVCLYHLAGMFTAMTIITVLRFSGAALFFLRYKINKN